MALSIKSTPENRKLVFNAIKAKILKHLEELEKKEGAELKKTFSELTGLLIKGGKGLPVGTIREWKGKKFIKVAPGKWKPKYDSETRGARMSIAAIKRKADSCEDAHSLMVLIFENKDRFSDENGAPLACVKELSDFIEQTRTEKEPVWQKREEKERKKAEKEAIKQERQRKKDLAGSGGGGDNREPPNGKKGKLQVLNKKELHDFIEKHKTSKENVRVSLGEISDEARNRIKEKTGLLVNRVILDSDSVRHAYSKPQHNLNPNDLDDMKNIIETTTDIEMGGINPQGNPIIIFKKQEVNGIILCEEYRAKNKELELQTAYRIKKEKRQPHGANERLPANVRNATAPTTSIPQSSEKSREQEMEMIARKEFEGIDIYSPIKKKDFDPFGVARYTLEEIGIPDYLRDDLLLALYKFQKYPTKDVWKIYLGLKGKYQHNMNSIFDKFLKQIGRNHDLLRKRKYNTQSFIKYKESREDKEPKNMVKEHELPKKTKKLLSGKNSAPLSKSIVWLENYLSKSAQKEESAIEALRKRLEKEGR